MQPGLESHLQIYSLGVAAENLTIGSKMLLVTPIEKLTFVDGELKSNPTADTVTGTDATGSTSSTSVNTDNAIEATWFPFHSNRHTPPDIRRGERVIIWRFADLDTFLWTELGLDQKYRKLETATYVWNATQDQTDNTTSDKNSYFVEVSTHKGTITLRTSKANGEKTAHTVQFNPMAGKFTLADDLGQIFYVDSVGHLMHMTNADGTQFTMDHQNFSVSCDDTFSLAATNAINIETKNFILKAENLTVNIEQQAQITAATIIGSATESVNIQAPSITLGQVTIHGGAVQCDTLGVTNQLTAGPIQAGHINCEGVDSTENVNAPNI